MPNNVISKIQLPNGNTYDIKDSEAKRKQTTVNDPTASGTAIEFIANISQDTEGVITPIKKTVTTVTASTDGLMSAADKIKLDGIAINAETNPNIATQSTNGLMSAEDKIKLDEIEPGAEVNPNIATISTNGLMSFSDKIKLDGIEVGAEANPGIATQLKDGLMSFSDKIKLDEIEPGAEVNPNIVNNLTETTIGKVLDATQGKILKDTINNLDETINNLKAEDVGAIKDDYSYNYVGYPYTGNELILLHNTTTRENTVTDVASFLSSAGGSGSGSGSNQGALVHYTKRISLNATAGTQAQSFSDSNITENMVVLQVEIEDPSAQINDWIFTTVNGMVTLNGTVNAATNVTLYFGVSLTAAPSIRVNLNSNNPDNILKANPQPGIIGVLGTANGGTGVSATDAADLRSKLSITPVNIGAIAKTGDAMTGSLTVPSLSINSDDFQFFFMRDANGVETSHIRSHPAERIIVFREFTPNISGVYEDYHLPYPTNQSNGVAYEILTTKNILTSNTLTTGYGTVTYYKSLHTCTVVMSLSGLLTSGWLTVCGGLPAAAAGMYFVIYGGSKPCSVYITTAGQLMFNGQGTESATAYSFTYVTAT